MILLTTRDCYERLELSMESYAIKNIRAEVMEALIRSREATIELYNSLFMKKEVVSTGIKIQPTATIIMPVSS